RAQIRKIPRRRSVTKLSQTGAPRSPRRQTPFSKGSASLSRPLEGQGTWPSRHCKVPMHPLKNGQPMSATQTTQFRETAPTTAMTQNLEDHRATVDSPLAGEHNAALIRCEDVCFSYGSKQALHNISLDVPERKVTAFIGPS